MVKPFTNIDEGVTLWRYMGLSKYVSLLAKASLYFCRSDFLGDKWEGSVSKDNYTYMDQIYGCAIPQSQVDVISDFRRRNREWVFVSCWHANEVESAAMWKLYGSTDESIAVRTTVGRLRECLPDSIRVEKVFYTDYESGFIPQGNILHPYLFKRKSFSHENEVRALLMCMPGDPEENLGVPVGDPVVGRLLEVCLGNLVTSVRVSPLSEAWYLESVKAVTDKFGLKVPVERSEIENDPIF